MPTPPAISSLHEFVFALAPRALPREVRIAQREQRWINKLQQEAASLPPCEEDFIREMMGTPLVEKFLPDQYALA